MTITTIIVRAVQRDLDLLKFVFDEVTLRWITQGKHSGQGK